MIGKIITWKQADAALIETAVQIIENMERICRTRKEYSGFSGLTVQGMGEQFDQEELAGSIHEISLIRNYFARVSGMVDEVGERRGLESIPLYSSGCSWAFTTVVLQALKESRGNLERLCYRQNKVKVKGPVASRNQG